MAICRTKFPVISNFGIFFFYNRVFLYVKNHHPHLYPIYNRFPEVSMLQQRNQSLFIISTYTILQAEHNDCSHKLFLISSLTKIHKFRMLSDPGALQHCFRPIPFNKYSLHFRLFQSHNPQCQMR